MKRRACLQTAGAALATGVLGACTLNADHNHSGPDAPRFAPLARPVRTAWVFSSGGPRGFVHVGVVKALEHLGLFPDFIVGASAGALVGSLCAAGLSAADLETAALDLQPWTLARLAVAADERWSGTAIANLVRRTSPQPLLERMPCAMACVVQRLRDQHAVAFTAGDVGLAVQASTAVEGQFAPVRIRGERYADPDWVMPLPVRLARLLGAQRVLAVDASADPDDVPPGAERYRASDLRKQALVNQDAPLADVLLKPNIGYWAGHSREYRERVIDAGYRATLAQASALKALHATPAL